MGKTLIRLLLQKQSDLSLHCLSRTFWEATSVQNFRIFTVIILFFMKRSTVAQVVECLTWDPEVAGLSLTGGTVLCP